MGVFSGPEIVSNNLILALDAGNIKSYVGSGTTWSDRSLLGNTGTLVGTTYNSSNGGYLVFNGTSDYVYTSNLITNPQIFTISAWFKTSSASGRKILGFESDQTGNFAASYDRMFYMGTDGKIYFGIYDGAVKLAISTSILSDSNWHYIVGTYGGEGTTMRLYVDGISNSTATATAPQNYNGYYRIGSYRLLNWTNSGDGFFPGNIAQVFIYNRALTASEVNQNFNALRGRFGI